LRHIEEWEHDTGQMFLINGLQFEAFIKKEHDDFAAEKENEKLLRVSSFHLRTVQDIITTTTATRWI